MNKIVFLFSIIAIVFVIHQTEGLGIDIVEELVNKMVINQPKLKKDLLVVIDDLKAMSAMDMQPIEDIIKILSSRKMQSMLKDIASEVDDS